jgi:hypothetical protein
MRGYGESSFYPEVDGSERIRNEQVIELRMLVESRDELDLLIAGPPPHPRARRRPSVTGRPLHDRTGLGSDGGSLVAP